MIDLLIHSFILGIVEGLTEFIPVSSTGHLILASSLLRADGVAVDVFNVFIQIGAIFAVIWARRERVSNLAIGFFNNAAERSMGLKIIAAFLPAAIAGVLFHEYIKAVLFSPWVVSVSLIVGGIIMLIVERMAPAPHTNRMDDMSFKTAIGIGLCQITSLIPGISRAGASLVGAQFLGVERRAATEFSFFLAIPTILGAAAYDLWANFDVLVWDDVPVFALGTITAFVSALIVVKFLIDFVGKFGFAPFAYYRMVAGAVFLALLYGDVI